MRSTRAVATSSQAVSELFNLENQDNTKTEIGNRKSTSGEDRELLKVADDVEDEIDAARGHSTEDRELDSARQPCLSVVRPRLMRAEVDRGCRRNRCPRRVERQ